MIDGLDSDVEAEVKRAVWVTVAVCAVILYGGLQFIGYLRGREAVAGEQVRVEARKRDTLVVERVRLETVYRRDTIRLRVATTRYDTARVTDTVMRGDTVYVNREVADSTIRACSAVVLTCEAKAANAESRAASFERSFNARTAELVATKRRGRLENAGWFLIGVGAESIRRAVMQ